MSNRIALFAGSFDPYTWGHHAIARKAAALFDRVYVMIGVNTAKRRFTDPEAMRAAIQAALDADGLENCTAVIHAGLVVDFCAENDVRWFVRGLRSAADYEYEENNARINQRLFPALETLYLRADDPVLSSSMIRELLAFGRPVEDFVPPSVMAVMGGSGDRERE